MKKLSTTSNTQLKLKKESVGISSESDASVSTNEASLPNLDELETKCKPPEFIQPRPKDSWAKPIWFAAMHHSFPDDIFRSLIQNLTNMNQGGKSFYVSTRGTLKHCYGVTETAACSIGDVPTKNFDRYQDKYMIFIRNPTTSLPYGANMKSIKYHGLDGQMPIDNWRSTRKEWMEGLIDGWIQHISNWKQTSYQLGMYIVYEDLYDYHKGPYVLKQMTQLLKEGGFHTIQTDLELQCAWLMSLGKENIVKYNERGYEFDDYIPGFTEEQKQMMIDKLSKYLEDMNGSDVVLESILKGYIKAIENNIVIDTE